MKYTIYRFKKEISQLFGAIDFQKLFPLLSVTVIILTVLIFESCGNPPWYHVPELNVNTPTSAVITGPQTVSPGTYTYTLTITFPKRISKDAAFFVRCDIYEDDVFGDVVLSRGVGVSFPANATSASTTFNITVADDGAGNISIAGTDGSDVLEDTWHIYAYVRKQTTSESLSGDNLAVTYSNP